MNKLIVLGSINMDLVVTTDRAPMGGETLAGIGFQTIPGGKGANQAVALARQGGDVALIARVGCDGFGEELLARLAEDKVDLKRVKKDNSCSTGIASIVVEKSGQNRIIIVAGANGQVGPSDVDESGELLDQCDYLVMQLETPLPTILYAIGVAKSKHIKTVLNAAPAPADSFDDRTFKQMDYLLVNETEAAILSGQSVTNLDSARSVAQFLQKKTDGVVILTMGDNGAITADRHSVWHTPAFKITPIDTTAAGDAFTGGLVTSLQLGRSLKEAVIYANASGAIAASRFGAQPSLPNDKEVSDFLKRNNPIFN